MTQNEHIIVAAIIQILLHVLFLNRFLYSKRDEKEAKYWEKVFRKLLGL